MRSLLAIALLSSGCSSCEPRETAAPRATVETVREEEAPIEEPAPEPSARPPRAQTRAERVARLAAMSEAERARLRTRDEQLREGRRLGRARDHEAALRAFEAAIAVAPHDATVRCEAGYQALQLGRLDDAERHLQLGLDRAARPATIGACFYNLARVHEERGDVARAIECLEDSLAARPSPVVSARLDDLRTQLQDPAALDEEEAENEWEEPEAIDFDAIAARAPEPTIQAFCAATGCRVDDARIFVPPRPSAAVRELRIVVYEDEAERQYFQAVVVRTDAGYRYVAVVARSDMGDSYGVLEGWESVEDITFEGDDVIVSVGGSIDEPEGEAEAYWRCEREHPDDDGAQTACFDEATADLAPPERWASEVVLRVEDGTLRQVEERSVEPAPEP